MDPEVRVAVSGDVAGVVNNDVDAAFAHRMATGERRPLASAHGGLATEQGEEEQVVGDLERACEYERPPERR